VREPRYTNPGAFWTTTVRHGGVDVVDQQLESILAIRMMYKWYKKITFPATAAVSS